LASIDKRGGRYIVRWRVGGGSRQKTFTSYKAATEHKAQIESEAAAGKAVDPVNSRTAFGAWYPVFEGGKLNVKAQTLATSRSLYDNHIEPRWGEVMLDHITQPDVQRWVANLNGKGLAAGTVRAVYAEFNAAMRAAQSARFIRESPCVGINLPTIHRDEVTVLDHDEIERLADAINRRYRALIVFLAYSGLRIGEAAALTWNDVDLEKRTVTVRYTVTELTGQGLSLSVPKTPAARRIVPLPRHVIDTLKQHRNAYPSRWVFTTTNGSQVNPRAFNRRSFHTALATAKLDCHVHDLRHTAISLWIRAGVDLPRVKAWAGHSTVTVTLNTYAKFFPTDDDGILKMLDTRITKAQKKAKKAKAKS